MPIVNYHEYLLKKLQYRGKLNRNKQINISDDEYNLYYDESNNESINDEPIIINPDINEEENNEDHISECPEFERLELIPNICNPGDEIILIAHYNTNKLGAYFYYSEYITPNIQISNPTNKTESMAFRETALQYLSENEKELENNHFIQVPILKCIAPSTSGTYDITFRARISFTGNKYAYYNDNNEQIIIDPCPLDEYTKTIRTQLIVQ